MSQIEVVQFGVAPKMPEISRRGFIGGVVALGASLGLGSVEALAAETPVNTFRMHRLSHLPDFSLQEAIYLEEWRRYVKMSPGVNAMLVTDPLVVGRDPKGFLSHYEKPTQHDIDLIATVIQWLGTSCGNAFLYSTEKRCQQEMQERHDPEYKSPLISVMR